jgi:hypothetical protein
VPLERSRRHRCLYLHNTNDPTPAVLDVIADRVDVRRQYEVGAADVRGYGAILVPMHADQRHLQAMGLDDYVDGGGAVLVNGHVAWRFLRELRPFVPVARRDRVGLTVHRESEHPIFARIAPEDLTFRRGVAGFYGRGANPAPPGAVVLHSVGRERLALDWTLERPGGGRLFVHAGNDLFEFLVRPEPVGAAPLRHLVGWLLGDTP